MIGRRPTVIIIVLALAIVVLWFLAYQALAGIQTQG